MEAALSSSIVSSTMTGHVNLVLRAAVKACYKGILVKFRSDMVHQPLCHRKPAPLLFVAPLYFITLSLLTVYDHIIFVIYMVVSFLFFFF